MKKIIALTFLLSAFLTLQAATIIAPVAPSESDTSEIAKSHSLLDKVIKEGRFIQSLDELFAVTLPQGIKKTIGNTENILVIESMQYTADGAKLTAYMSIEVPNSGRKIALKGKDIPFAPGGFTGGARLELLGNQEVSLGENMTLILKGDQGKTFVECDCQGYKEMGLQGEIEFSRNKFIPEGPDGEIIADTKVKVKAPFETKIVGWEDFMLELGITPFRVKDMKDFSFSVTSAVFDFSESANAPSMVFPEGYESSDFVDGNRNMWKGFFLKDLVVKLPGNLSKKDSTTRTTIEAHNLLIDNIGLSGKFLATNVFTLDEGDMSKWAFSLDEIYAEITKNQLVECGFKGTMNVPPLGDSTILSYEAFIDPANQYTFIVETNDTINMSIWAAKLRLDPNSYVDISVIDGKFRPKAVLNGKLSVATDKVELADVEFEELTITPEAPYLKAKAFSFGSEYASQKLGKFPIAISNVGMVTTDNRTGLKFDLTLNLTKTGSGGFTGETGLVLYAKSYEENSRQRWKYDGFEVNKIAIDIDGGSYKLKGGAQWYKNDPVYGNGFSGNLSAQFSKLPQLTATAIFGNINGMRYFYADALATLNSGVPIFTGVKLYTFGGGIYHHMRQLGYNEESNSTLGKTASGIIYKPDEQTFLGLKATVGLGGTKKETYNADVTFEMAFNNNAGVDRIVFIGNGYFMAPPENASADKIKDKCKDIAKGKDPNTQDKKSTDASKSSLYAFVNLDFDFRNEVIHGNLGVYINLPGGVLTGIGPGGKAGEAVMHFAKDEWYVYVGTPSDRIGVRALKFAELNAYFMMGTKIPASPPPPAKVSEILGGIDLDYMASENAIGEGKGIGFGAGLQFNTGHKKFGPFYAEFDAGAGFDVMLKNYGVVNCKGQSEPLGINGWYANGQVWAYLEGAIGVEVKLKFIHGKFEIIRVGAAAVLQAKLPNPFWMRGIIGGRYSILGGLVSGNCRFDFTVGEECEIVGGASPVQGIEVISEVTPGDGAVDVNVFNAAQAIFNMPIDKTFELEDMDGKKLSFKIALDHFQVKNGSQVLPGELEWNAEKDVVVFNSFEILPPEKQLNLDVQVSFKEKKNGSWQTVMVDGTKVVETLKTSFTTGTAPDNIPINNVKYSYPLPMMFNYYQNETDIGYIQLDKGQEYLFKPGSEWKQVGRFEDKQGNKHEFNFTYNAAERKVNFTRPGNLQNNAIYSFELVNVPAQTKGAVDKNVTAKLNKKNVIEGNETTIEIQTKKAEGTLEILDEKNIFGTYFRTSKYNKFLDKIENLRMSEGFQWPLRPRVHLIYKGIDGGEIFDQYEVNGTEKIIPLVRFTNLLTNYNWYKKETYPYIYENYPIESSIFIKEREIEPVGLPPYHTINIIIRKDIPLLTEDNIKYNYVEADIGAAAFHSYFVHYSEIDYSDIAAQVCAKYFDNSNINNRLKHLLEVPFPIIYPGNYPFKIEYILPGINQLTSSKVLTIKLQ